MSPGPTDAPPAAVPEGAFTPKDKEELPAGESYPPGVTPPLPDELAYLAEQCRELVEIYEQTVNKDAALADTLLITPPTLKGVAEPGRCAKILAKRVAVSRVREIEKEPMLVLRGISDKAQLAKGDCASAPAVPRELGTLARGPVRVAPGDYSAPGWRCVDLPAMQETRAQYEYRKFESDGVFEAIARVHTVPGYGATELFIRGNLGGPPTDFKVLRRAPTAPVLEPPPAPAASASGSAGSTPPRPGSGKPPGSKAPPGKTSAPNDGSPAASAKPPSGQASSNPASSAKPPGGKPGPGTTTL